YYDFNWLKYFYNLLLHNYFFPDTSYELTGFTRDNNGNLMSVVRQLFVEENKATDPKEIEKYLLERGFIRTHRLMHVYENKELGITLADLHIGNVLTQDDVLRFIDTEFFIDEPLSIHREGGEFGDFDNSEKNTYIQKIIRDELQHIISGEGKVSNGTIVETGSSYIGRSEGAGSTNKRQEFFDNKEGTTFERGGEIKFIYFPAKEIIGKKFKDVFKGQRYTTPAQYRLLLKYYVDTLQRLADDNYTRVNGRTYDEGRAEWIKPRLEKFKYFAGMKLDNKGIIVEVNHHVESFKNGGEMNANKYYKNTTADFKLLFSDKEDALKGLKEILRNNGLKYYMSAGGSTYAIKDDVVYRLSDHWGKLDKCVWNLLNENNEMVEIKKCDFVLGSCPLSEFKSNEE
ncbi:MAG: hypothetical protein AABY22_33610, partial [Nanoarchaeota archaeon]